MTKVNEGKIVMNDIDVFTTPRLTADELAFTQETAGAGHY
jgi:hypothetical protein